MVFYINPRESRLILFCAAVGLNTWNQVHRYKDQDNQILSAKIKIPHCGNTVNQIPPHGNVKTIDAGMQNTQLINQLKQ